MKSWLSLCGTELLAYLILPWPLCYEIPHCSLTFGSFHQMETPEDGVLVHGLFMDGFWLDSENMTWTDSIKGEWGACGDRWMLSGWDLEDRWMLSGWDLETGGCWVNEIWRQVDVNWMRFRDRWMLSGCDLETGGCWVEETGGCWVGETRVDVEWGRCGDRWMLSGCDLETGGCWVDEMWRQVDVEWRRCRDRWMLSGWDVETGGCWVDEMWRQVDVEWRRCRDRWMLSGWDLETGGCWVDEMWRQVDVEWRRCRDRWMLSGWDVETGGCWVDEIWRQVDVEWRRCGDRWMLSGGNRWMLCRQTSGCWVHYLILYLSYLSSPQVKWTRVFPWCSVYVLLRSNKLESSHDALFICSSGQITQVFPWCTYNTAWTTSLTSWTSTQPCFTRWPRRPACCSPPITPPTIYVLAVQLLSDLLQDDWMAKGAALPCQHSEWAKYLATRRDRVTGSLWSLISVSGSLS